MAKFCGEIGFAEVVQAAPGVHREQVTEHVYYGDVIKNARRYDNGGKINTDVSLNNTISVVMDDYLTNHFFAIRYVRWMGVCWSIESVEIQHPRAILTIGGIYNGETV